jgi:hypothetical protein
MKINFSRVFAGLALSLLFPLLSVAQSAFGVQAGLNMSNATVDGPTPFVTSSQGNFFLGLTAHTLLRNRWSLSSDAQITKRGFFLYQVRSVSGNRIGLQTIYMDIASSLEYNVFKNISLQLGSYAGYRLVEHDQLVGSDNWIKAVLPITDQWDLGLQAGITARFHRWAAFVRYSHGLKAVARLEVTDQPGVIKIFNRGLEVGASYVFF